MDDSNTANINTETFECENCGGLMKFNITKQIFACESCGAECEQTKAVKTDSGGIIRHDFNKYRERESSTVPFTGLAVTGCQRCGMEISFDEKQVSAVCPMCASTQVATVKQGQGVPPDGIVPFKVDKRDAQQKFKVWVKSRWFAPNDFKKKYGEGDLKGMYLPFWTYDADAVSRYSGRGGRYRRVKDKDGKERTVTDWTPVSGSVSSSFDDIQVNASKQEKVINGILPYGTNQNTKPFSASYFSGYYAEVYKIKADTAFNDAKKIMENRMRNLAAKDITRQGYDTADVNSIDTRYNNVMYRHVLFPLWESAFGYSGKTYIYMVNGETGKVNGQRPYSPAKIAAAVVAAIAALVTVIMLTGAFDADAAELQYTEYAYNENYIYEYDYEKEMCE